MKDEKMRGPTKCDVMEEIIMNNGCEPRLILRVVMTIISF